MSNKVQRPLEEKWSIPHGRVVEKRLAFGFTFIAGVWGNLSQAVGVCDCERFQSKGRDWNRFSR